MIAVNTVLPHEQPRTARDQDGRNHRRLSNAIGKPACRYSPDDESETEERNGVGEQPWQPHRLVPEQPRCAECQHDQAETAEAFLAGRAAEECPPDDERDGEDEGHHHASSEAFDSGDDGFDTEACEPLQDDGHDAGPNSQGIWGSHAALYFRRHTIVPSV